MSISGAEPAPGVHLPSNGSDTHRRERKTHAALAEELQAALAREQVLIQKTHELSLHQLMLAQEFEHRLINGLQLITSLLTMQSRAAPNAEAAAQLTIAARRVASLGRVHRQLHLLDHQTTVELGQYLRRLCEDLSELLFEDRPGYLLHYEGVSADIPTSFAIPIGFIVNELITNSAKYSKGKITVRFETTAPGFHSLSVLDDGPGLPADFDPTKTKGLGMKIVRSLVKQVNGELHIGPGEDGGTCFKLTFSSNVSIEDAAAAVVAAAAVASAAPLI